MGTSDVFFCLSKIVLSFTNKHKFYKGKDDRKSLILRQLKGDFGHLNHWLPELFAKNALFNILEIFWLDMSRISSNLLQKAFAIL